MQYITQKKVYINRNELIELEAIAGDLKTRFIDFHFFNNVTCINLSNCKVRIYAKTSNYTSLFNDLEIIDAAAGIARLELTNTLLVPGKTEYQLKIYDENGGILSSNVMNINVEKNLMDDKAIESTNEFTALDNMLKDVTNIQININKANTNAKSALDTINVVKEEIKSTENNLNNSIKNIETNLVNNVNKDIKSLKQVKGIPHNELICFIPTKTNRYLESFEIIEDKGEMIAGYTNMDESINKIAELQKFNLYTKESKSYKEVDGLGHCNDLAYYPAANELYVATITGANPGQLLVLDYNTLNIKRWQPISNLTGTITGVAYNKEKDLFIIKTDGSTNIHLVDTSFNITKEFTINQEATFQTICSNGDYLYFMMNNIIKVYNLETEEITIYRYDYKGEPEGSAVLSNGNVLLTFNTPGQWHFDTPRIFEIDFTRKSTHGNLNSYYGADGRRITECKQFLYLVHHGSSWDLILDESNAGDNLYSAAGNNFFAAIKRGSSLDIKTRAGILYEQDKGLILNCMCIPNYTALKNGITMVASYDKSKHAEIDFFKDGKNIDESEVPSNAGFRLYLNIGVHALS